MAETAYFLTRQRAADHAVSYSIKMEWGATGTRVKTAKAPNKEMPEPFFAMAKHDDGKWRRIP